jgi:2-oxoglutarate dehydrogenase E2 component (dihydrolipoamide succinyltransferase)
VAIDLVVPEVGESITEVLIAQWLVAEGDIVERDQPLAELESDKATIELPAPSSGRIAKLLKPKGAIANVGEVIGQMLEGVTASAGKAPAGDRAEAQQAQPALVAKPKQREAGATPSARRVAAESGVDLAVIAGSGKGGMVLREDVEHARSSGGGRGEQAGIQPEVGAAPVVADEEDHVPMSPIRRTIAARLLQSQHESAQLTTFQEVDMSAVYTLRAQYKDAFLAKFGVKLGLMSFFIKAAIEALKAYPAVNAEIRDSNIVYKNYYNIGIAVGGGKGLVVPVMRNAERLSFAEVEQQIADFGRRAGENKIALDELAGGTFTISNGGVYGSLLSTPILNPPQSGVLGLHAIKERPVVVAGAIAIRPIMYVALTYDHRMVDGRESVGFLMKVKETIEDPARILLEV